MEKWQPGLLVLVVVLGFACIQPVTASGDWNVPVPTQTASMWGIFTPQPTNAVQPWSYAGGGPSATAFPVEGDAPLTVSFSSTASIPPMSWNFGDGSSSAEQNPVHTYETCGNYTVTLSAHDVYGNDITVPAGVVQVCTVPSAKYVDIVTWTNDGETTIPGVGVYYRQAYPVDVSLVNRHATIGSFAYDPVETYLGSTGPDGRILDVWIPFGYGAFRTQSPPYTLGADSWYYSGDDLYYVNTMQEQIDLYLSDKHWVQQAPMAVNPVYTDEDNGGNVVLAPGGRFTIELYENPTTGFQWNVTVTPGLTVVNDSYTTNPHPEGMVGVGGIHRWEIEATGAGDQTFLGIYKQSWMPTIGDETSFTLHIRVN